MNPAAHRKSVKRKPLHRLKSISRPRFRNRPKVEVWSDALLVTFEFGKKTDAEEFFDSCVRSVSVTGATLIINGKFAGARDGMGA